MDSTINHSTDLQLINKKTVVYFIGEIGLGGSETQLSLLLKYINKKTIKPHIVVFNKSSYGDLTNRLTGSGVVLHYIPDSIRSIPKRMIFLYRLLLKIKPQVIHSWSMHDNIYAGIIGRSLKISSIFGSVRGALHGSTFIRSTFIIKLISLIWVNKIVVNALSIKEELIAIGIPLKRIIFLPNCVEINPIKDLEKNNNTVENEDKDIIICTIGNLRKNKNHLFFVKIMDNIIKSVTNVKGWIIGQPVPDEPQLENVIRKKIHSMGLEDKIILLGFQDNTTELLKRSSIYVFTSLSEGTPNTILEAMASGLPVISSNVGGISQIITHGVNGFLFDLNDQYRFEKTIKHLLMNKRLRKSVGKNAMIFVKKNHDPNKISSILESIYTSRLNYLG